MNIILYAIPFFFLLIGIELAAEAIKRSGYYRVNDAINSLSMGLLSRMTGIIKQVIPIRYGRGLRYLFYTTSFITGITGLATK
jgi:hypothetical protein